MGAAEAECNSVEANWRNKPDFQIRSMAQTRAMAKALRSKYGFVAVLAGAEATPAEEMEPPKGHWEPSKPIPQNSKPLEAKIVKMVKQLGYQPKTKDDYAEITLSLTDLPLEPQNYKEIVGRLSVQVKEKVAQ